MAVLAAAAVWVVATSATTSTFTSASTAASLALSRPRLREMLRERAGFAAVSGLGSWRALLLGRAAEISGVSPRGMGCFDKRLDGCQIFLIIGRCDRIGLALTSRPPGAPNSVHIIFGVGWHVKVKDMADGGNVQAPCGNV